jgi:hypothetical protein
MGQKYEPYLNLQILVLFVPEQKGRLEILHSMIKQVCESNVTVVNKILEKYGFSVI